MKTSIVLQQIFLFSVFYFFSSSIWANIDLNTSSKEYFNNKICQSSKYPSKKENLPIKVNNPIRILRENNLFPTMKEDSVYSYRQKATNGIKSISNLQAYSIGGQTQNNFLASSEDNLNQINLEVFHSVKSKYLARQKKNQEFYESLKDCIENSKDCHLLSSALEDFNQKLKLLRVYLALLVQSAKNSGYEIDERRKKHSENIDPLTDEEQNMFDKRLANQNTDQKYRRILNLTSFLETVKKTELNLNDIYQILTELKAEEAKVIPEDLADYQYFSMYPYLVEFALENEFYKAENIEKNQFFCIVVSAMQEIQESQKISKRFISAIAWIIPAGLVFKAGGVLSKTLITSPSLAISITGEVAISTTLSILSSPLWIPLDEAAISLIEDLEQTKENQKLIRCYNYLISDFKDGTNSELKEEIEETDSPFCNY